MNKPLLRWTGRVTSIPRISLAARFKEYVRDEPGKLALPFSAVLRIASAFLWALGRPRAAFALMSIAFRFNWIGPSKWVGRRIAAQVQGGLSDKFRQVLDGAVRDFVILPSRAKFYDDPTKLFEGVVIVLKPWTHGQRGVILVKYSYYFMLLEKVFDIASLQSRYWLVVEPSWNGYCDESVLCFLRYPEPVFVLTPEKHDQELLERLDNRLPVVPLGSNTFVDHRLFVPSPSNERHFDLVMIAAWSHFKRHDRVFAAIHQLKKQGRELKVALVGYGGDLGVEGIRQLAVDYDVSDQISWYDTVPAEQVHEVLISARVSILWSSFEGSGRVITESMFCGVPCVVREGLNYGQRYHYVNAVTGRYANESSLASTLEELIDNPLSSIDMRNYMMNHMSCEASTRQIAEVIGKVATEHGCEFDGQLEAKVNFLDGMRYFRPEAAALMENDYKWLTSIIRQDRFLNT